MKSHNERQKHSHGKLVYLNHNLYPYEVAHFFPELNGASFRALNFFAYFHSADRASDAGVVVDFNNDTLKAYVAFRH